MTQSQPPKKIASSTALYALAIAASVFTVSVAHAHSYTQQLKARKFDEVDKATQVALAASPGQVDALLGRVDLLLSLNQESKTEEAVKLAEQCVQAHPQQSECHEALGNALGTKAMNSGFMSAIGYAGTIRDSFKKAVELDPKNWSARFSLLQYFQQAPGIAGGGKGKANDLVAQTSKLNADAGKLMQASMDLADKEFSKAEAVVQTPLTTDTPELQDRQRDLATNLGFAYVREKKFADALRVFSDMQKRYADYEMGAYGAGRTLQEQGKHAEAIAQFEKSASLKVNASTHYRMGQSWQSLNDKSKASAAYERALAFKPELSKKLREDAQDQLKSLKG